MSSHVRTMAQNLFFVVLYIGHVALTLGAQDSLIYDFFMEQSHVHEIFVKWNVSDEFEIERYVVRHQKKGRLAMTYSGPLPNGTDSYMITDLSPKTDYEVCLLLTLVRSDFCQRSADACISCLDLWTIPLIRDDSLIAVMLTLGTIVFLILIGYLCWHYAKKRLENNGEEEGSEHGSDESKQPILLAVPPTSNGPRRSVDFEDQDIPYIDEASKRDETTKDTTVTNV